VDRGAVKRMHEVLNISKSYAIEQNQTFALLSDVAKSKVREANACRSNRVILYYIIILHLL
jgi:hypothetical protein